MANGNLLDQLEQRTGIESRRELAEALDRVLTSPQQETLAEALAADAVDVVPIVGDALALSRQEEADAMGINYPERPAVIENALSDLPPPFDTAFDIIIAQNTISHLEREQGIPLATTLENTTSGGARSVNEALDDLLNVGPN